MAISRPAQEITVPLGYPTSLIYMDESGVHASGAQFFVLSAVKIRRSGAFARAVADIRDKRSFRGEFKFNKVRSGTLNVYYDLIDVIEKADVHFAAFVVDGSVYSPFGSRKPAWRIHADLATQLLSGCINRRELVTVLMDGFSTPAHVALDDIIAAEVNKKLGSVSIVSAACLDSCTCDGLQVADLIAGAVRWERASAAAESPYKSQTPKAQVANRLRAAFGGVDFGDGRTVRTNILTLQKPKRKTTKSPAKRAGRVPAGAST